MQKMDIQMSHKSPSHEFGFKISEQQAFTLMKKPCPETTVLSYIL
jgi:hypothetical protein